VATLAIDGASVLLLVNVNGTPTAVGEQTNLSNSAEREMIDASHKQRDHTFFVYGKQDDTLSLESLYITGDAGLTALRSAQLTKTPVILRRSESGSAVQENTGLVASIEDTWPDNDVATVSVEIQLIDFWTTLA